MSRPSEEQLAELEQHLAHADLDAARALLAELFNKYPESVALKVVRARLAAYDGDAGGAIAGLEKLAATDDPDAPTARAYYGAMLQAIGQHERAIGELEAALAAGADVPAARFALGVSLMYAERAADAVGHLDAAAQQMPASPSVWFWLGEASEAAGDLERATEAYARCAVAEPRYDGAFVALARVHAARGDVDMARSTVEEGLVHNPGDPALLALQTELSN
jgi:predicted Zn-dependent protease